MASVKVILKDGTVHEFNQQSRAGGSWINSVEYQPGWVVVTDLYEKKHAWPADTVQEVIEIPSR